MLPPSDPQRINLQIAWPIVLFGAGLGAVLAWGILSGDQQGRVNLLYLLLVYLFLPLGSLIISTLSLLKGRGFNLARLIVALPVWSHQKRMLLSKTRQLHVEKYWLFFQSHLAALAFSVSSLAVFFILLFATDINFVWRSTLLSATDLQPLLKSIATPWFFWADAQPTVELLEATQDSRLQTLHLPVQSHANWWRFVLAIQLFYCIFLRSCLLGVTAALFRSKAKSNPVQKASITIRTPSDLSSTPTIYQPPVTSLPANIVINNWAKVDLGLLADFQFIDLSADNSLNAGPLATAAEQNIAEHWQGEQLVLVKSWEPPMGELADFLQTGKGFIWPVDWSNDTPNNRPNDKSGDKPGDRPDDRQDTHLVPVRAEHLQEWQRFVDHLPTWQVYMPEQLIPQASA